MQFSKISRVSPARPETLVKAKNQLVSDFNTLLADAEDLLKCTASYSGDALAGARSKFSDTLEQVKGQMSDAQSALAGKVDRTTVAAQEYVHENPWKVVGAVALAGLIIGALLNNRR